MFSMEDLNLCVKIQFDWQKNTNELNKWENTIIELTHSEVSDSEVH